MKEDIKVSFIKFENRGLAIRKSDIECVEFRSGYHWCNCLGT